MLERPRRRRRPPSSVAIADSDTPGVVVTQSDGTTRLVEGTPGTGAGSVTDTYTVRLTRAPRPDHHGHLDPQVDAAPATPGDHGRLRPDRPDPGHPERRAHRGRHRPLPLLFDDTNWSTEQVITVTAIDDSIVDGNDLQAFAPVARRAGTSRARCSSAAATTRTRRTTPRLDGYLPLVAAGRELRPARSPPVAARPSASWRPTRSTASSCTTRTARPPTSATLTSTRITGLGMAPDTSSPAACCTAASPTADLEDLTVLLGYGNDTFTVDVHPRRHHDDRRRRRQRHVQRAAPRPATRRLSAAPATTCSGSAPTAPPVLGMLDGSARCCRSTAATGTDTAYARRPADTDPNLGRLTQTRLTGLDMTPAPARWYLRPGPPLDQLFGRRRAAGSGASPSCSPIAERRDHRHRRAHLRRRRHRRPGAACRAAGPALPAGAARRTESVSTRLRHRRHQLQCAHSV